MYTALYNTSVCTCLFSTDNVTLIYQVGDRRGLRTRALNVFASGKHHTELSDARIGLYLYKCTLAKAMFLAKYYSRLFDTPISLSLITASSC